MAEYSRPGKSPETLRNKRRSLPLFAAAVPTLPCTKGEVMRFIDRLDLHQNTREMYFRQVRTFLYWCRDEHQVECPSLRGVSPGVLVEKPDPFTVEEAGRFLAAADSPRNRLMFELMFMTGMRSGGVRTLLPENVYPNYILTTEKTGQMKYTITPEMAKALKALGSSPVFVDTRGQPLARSGVAQRVQSTCRRAGIVKTHMGGHLLRHTVGSMIYQQSGDLKAVQSHLGHKTLGMANRYATLSDQQRQLTFNEYNPLAYVKNGGAR